MKTNLKSEQKYLCRSRPGGLKNTNHYANHIHYGVCIVEESIQRSDRASMTMTKGT